MIHYTKDEVVEVIHSQSRIPAMDNLAPRLREEVFDMGDAVVVCYPYVKSEQQKIAEARLAEITKRCLNPDPIVSQVVAVHDI